MTLTNRQIFLTIVFSWLMLQSALSFHEAFVEHASSDNCQICQLQDRNSDDVPITTNNNFIVIPTLTNFTSSLSIETLSSTFFSIYHSRAPPRKHS